MTAVNAAVFSWLPDCLCVELIDHHKLFPCVNYALCYSFSQNIIIYYVFSNSNKMCCRKCNWTSDTGCHIFQHVLSSLKKHTSERPTLCNPMVLCTHRTFQCIVVKYLFWLLWCLCTNHTSYSLFLTSRWHFWQQYFSMIIHKLTKLSVHLWTFVANMHFPQPTCFCILLSSMLSIPRICPYIFDCYLVHLMFSQLICNIY
jgi:hypothetical protein